MATLKLVTPGTEPVTLAEAKAYARIEQTLEDDLVTAWIAFARAEAERATGRQLTTTATWRLTLDRFPQGGWMGYATPDRFPAGGYLGYAGPIHLPRPPLLGVTQIQYLDQAGALQTLSPALYVVGTDGEPGCVNPPYLQVWPFTAYQPGAVIVTYTAGYATPAAIPETFKDAIKWLVSWKWNMREEAIPDAFGSMLAGHWHGWHFPELMEVTG